MSAPVTPNADSTRLSRYSAVPLYRQLKQRLLAMINSGGLAPHDRLPSERELIERFGISRITARQALTELAHEGRVYSAPGKGFFVAQQWAPVEFNGLMSFTELAERSRRRPGTAASTSGVTEPDETTRELLGLAADDAAVELLRVRTLDDVPVLAERAFLPTTIGQALVEAGIANRSLFAALVEVCGLRPGRSSTVISARLATADEADWLELPPTEAILLARQVTYAESAEPICVTYSSHHPTRFPITVTDTATEQR